MTRTSMTIAAASILAALSASPAGAKTDKDAWRAATPSGPALDCVPISDLRDSRVRDDSTIDFYTRSGRVLRNVLPNSCPGLAVERAFSYSTSISRLCSVDIITVLYQTPNLQRGASCGLGKFQPVTGAPR